MCVAPWGGGVPPEMLARDRVVAVKGPRKGAGGGGLGGSSPQVLGGRWYLWLRAHDPQVFSRHATQRQLHEPHPGLFWGKSPSQKK